MGRRADAGTGSGKSCHGQRLPLRSCWLFCASKEPWASGRGAGGVPGHSSHLLSLSEAKPRKLEWSFHLLMCPWPAGPELGPLGFSHKCLESLPSQLGQANGESPQPWYQPGWGVGKD